jgi:ribosomal protein S6
MKRISKSEAMKLKKLSKQVKSTKHGYYLMNS